MILQYCNMTISPSAKLSAIEGGYRYECPCGEWLNSIKAAANCKKCRDYAPAMAGRFVVDIKTDEVVQGAIPTKEEYDLILEAHDRVADVTEIDDGIDRNRWPWTNESGSFSQY